MAYLINCGTDWTYDLFMEDAKLYNATPMKGVYCSKDASDRNQFMVWFKNCARDFKAKWLEEHEGHLYDIVDGYIGDAFAKTFDDICFSDFYKDTYNQRPHLDRWFYIRAVGFPTDEDIARTFCATPVENAIEAARYSRTHWD